MKKIKLCVLLVSGAFLLAATNASAAWYKCKITNVTPKPNGEVAMKFINGTGATDCVGNNGVCLAVINPNDAGAKNMYATVLTAVSLGSEVTISLASTPTYDYQDVDGISLDAN